MAYFPNGDAGMLFDEQCGQCRYGERGCPIWAVQGAFNYSACNVPVARAILDKLVSNDGTCAMFAFDPENFKDRRVADQPYIGGDRREPL